MSVYFAPNVSKSHSVQPSSITPGGDLKSAMRVGALTDAGGDDVRSAVTQSSFAHASAFEASSPVTT